MRTSVRLRLTLWYAGSLAVVMAAYGAFVYATQRANLVADFERQLEEDHESVERYLKQAEAGGADWRAELSRLWPEHDGYDRRVEVRRADGALLFASASSDAMSDPRASGAHPYRLDGTPVTVSFVRPQTRLRHELNQLLLVLALGVPLGVALAALGGWALARRALTPVGQMAERARTITASNLSQRLPVENPDDEFGRLATVFNETLARLEASFEQLRRFTADASHELRTPLTAIRAVGEVGLRQERTAEEYREVVGSMLEEVDRLSQLVESLLKLSRADAGRIALDPEAVDLAALARDVAGHLSALAEEKRQTIDVRVEDEARVTADRAILRLALVNLLDNAIKYGPPGTPVRISVGVADGSAAVAVADEGPGIPREHLARIFDRFYRVDAARSREVGGAGLGLAIALWAVEAHGGHIDVVSEEGRGSRFTVVLPLRRDTSVGGAS